MELIASANGVSLRYDQTRRRYAVETSSAYWEQTDVPETLRLTVDGGSAELCLDDARDIRVTPLSTGLGQGVSCRYDGFFVHGADCGISLETRVWLDARGELHCELIPLREEPACFVGAQWPAPFSFPELRSDWYTLLPVQQGYLIQNGYPREVSLPEEMLFYDRPGYMPWWGQIRAGSGVAVIVETPWDAAYSFTHPAGGPTEVRARWRASLGKLRSPRRLRMVFRESCDYNDLCKAYRSWARERGKLVTLREKAARNPRVRELYGCPVFHTGGWYHCVPDSQLYDRENPAQNDRLLPFAEVAALLDEWKRRGVERLYLHLDGWGRRGYDNLHPDILPPAERTGGWEGLRRLAAACRESGYLFALHDQYRDYYFDADSFSQEHAVRSPDGATPDCDIWAGGRHAFLCAVLAPEYVRRNYDALAAEGIVPDGVYLDVFSVAPPDECAHPAHPMTRRECLEYRAECLNVLRARDIVVSSEEACDWAMPYLELCHHAPFRVDGDCIPYAPVLPLFELCWHDAVVVPWSCKPGDWYIPRGDHPLLYAMLYGGTSYLLPGMSDDTLETVRAVCWFHERIADRELLRHEFDPGDPRIQRTFFMGGGRAEVNLETGAYRLRIDGETRFGKASIDIL